MADKTFTVLDGTSKKLKDMGDGTFAEIVAFTADSPLQLTGTVVVDTLGALTDAKVVDPDAASATLPALARGQLTELLALKASIGAVADLAWSSGDGTEIAILKNLAAACSRLISSATNVAAGSALATTSLVVGSRYNATPPTFTDGQEGALQINSAGHLLTTDAQLATLITAIGSPSDAKWNGTDASASLIAISKKIAAP